MAQDLQKVKLENKSLQEENTTLTTAKETAEAVSADFKAQFKKI